MADYEKRWMSWSRSCKELVDRHTLRMKSKRLSLVKIAGNSETIRTAVQAQPLVRPVRMMQLIVQDRLRASKRSTRRRERHGSGSLWP